jgi:hypothetical protein
MVQEELFVHFKEAKSKLNVFMIPLFVRTVHLLFPCFLLLLFSCVFYMYPTKLHVFPFFLLHLLC